MNPYHFLDDYSEGCHPRILDALANTNLTQQTAYGDDEYSERARALIREHLGEKNTPIHFVAGGTLANLIIMASALRPHEAIIAANSGHIAQHETGAIEATGHKIITVPSKNGKLTDADIESALASNSLFPHMAKPRLVYISNTTEMGTVYKKAELRRLSETCRANGLLLALDGARLGAALTAETNDLTMKEIADLTDIFWIGGTKAGALLGEAIVIPNEALAVDFAFHVKQRGALLAKGRLLGIQFLELFSNDLYFTLTRHANAMARKLSNAIISAGHALAAPTESNQIFAILPNREIERLKPSYAFYEWEKVHDQHSLTRIVTSWATDEAKVDAFIRDIHATNT